MHAAYLDGDGNSINNYYSNPFYNSQYSQQDPQFPYGFPIPGLTNQQQAGLYQPANQHYQPKGTASQNTGGQYYVPELTSQNQGGINLVPAGNQVNQQWPLGNGIGSQVYQNNPAYQGRPQQGYVPAQPGFIQNPVQPVQPVNQNIQPVQNNIAPGLQQALTNQVPGNAVNQNLMPVQNVAVAPSAAQDNTVVPKSKSTGNVDQVKSQDSGFLIDHLYDTADGEDETDKQKDSSQFGLASQNHNYDSDNDEENSDRNDKVPTMNHKSGGILENDNDVLDIDRDSHRHSSEEDDYYYNRERTYPPATKTKTQIASPTLSTVSGQKTGQTHSEGFPDYSWIKYDDDSPRISGKKGKTHLSSQNSNLDTENLKNQPDTADVKSSSDKSSKEPDIKQENPNKPGVVDVSDTKYNDDKYENGRYNTDSRYPDEYRFQYDDYRRPNSNRRPSYDQYQNRYGNSRRRPSPGTRYPYYDTGYQRGWDRDRDRDRLPVWDPFKDEYYYPDVYDDRHPDHGVDYSGPAGTEYIVHQLLSSFGSQMFYFVLPYLNFMSCMDLQTKNFSFSFEFYPLC